jgi:RNA 3'-terminal phosphate cyclase (ATP)
VLTLDGSAGEGGGQILRSALALSLLTGTPFRIEKIRARRAKPGLLRQHLTAVQAAARIGGAEVEGAELGSRTLTLRPGSVAPGEHHFAIGSAGSACLVVQTVLPPLLLARGPSVLVVEGGTHNPAAPSWDFLARAFFPLLERMGARIRTTLERHGFYPAGGGRVRVEIDPVPGLAPLELLQRGEIVDRSARALVAHLPRNVGERELRVVCDKLSGFAHRAQVVDVKDTPGPGNAVLVELVCEHVTELFAGYGERGVRAEEVADRVVQEVRSYLLADAPVGLHLADQLILPLALAGGGVFRTLPLTLHTQTNLEVVQRFLSVRSRCTPEANGCVRVEIERVG